MELHPSEWMQLISWTGASLEIGLDLDAAEWVQLISWAAAALVIGAKGLDAFLASLANIVRNGHYLWDELRAAYGRLEEMDCPKRQGSCCDGQRAEAPSAADRPGEEAE